MKGKTLQPRILYLARNSFRFIREIKNSTDKQKLKEFSTTKPLYKKCLKDFSKQKWKGHNKKHENYAKKNLIGKDKYRVKVVNHPCIKLVGRQNG